MTTAGKVLIGVLSTLAAIVIVAIIGSSIYFNCTVQGKAAWNNYWHDVDKVDDNTSYENRKQVEDTCRSMISSYNADKLTYEQYKDSESDLERSWANSAKMRANQTASNYNNYILKNSYIWRGNVPSDIYMTLAYLQ